MTLKLLPADVCCRLASVSFDSLNFGTLILSINVYEEMMTTDIQNTYYFGVLVPLGVEVVMLGIKS